MILIQPFSKKLPNGENPKNYPYWKELVSLIEEPIIQLGEEGDEKLVEDFRTNVPFAVLERLVKECRTFIGIDSFLQHLAWYHNKKGVVLWGQSDPLIFGHDIHINLLKGREYLRDKQFDIWVYTDYNQTKYRDDCWVLPEEVIKNI